MMTLTVLCQDGTKEKIEDVVPQSNDRKWCAENALFTVDGMSKIQNRGQVPERILREMQAWIRDNHKAMEKKWNAYGVGGFYVEVDKI